ncbi:MAG: GIY-YIG nuclease family protein [Myxococcota bacterium]
MNRPWFVYIARCNDGTLYTGVALDVAERIASHNRGRGARYTRGRAPIELCVKRRCASQGDALRLEIAVKRLDRDAKERLIVGSRLARFARALLRAAS